MLGVRVRYDGVRVRYDGVRVRYDGVRVRSAGVRAGSPAPDPRAIRTLRASHLTTLGLDPPSGQHPAVA
jgi:hypothetical protein